MSSLVSSLVRSVAGKITRSALDTRSSRPPASTKASFVRAIGAEDARSDSRGLLRTLTGSSQAAGRCSLRHHHHARRPTMSFSTRKIAAVLSAVSLMGATAIGAAEAASSGSGTQTAKQGGQGHDRGPRPLSTAQLAKIASALGVTTDQLKSALDENRPAKPSGDDAKHGPQQFAGDLASALGVDTSAVKTILDANRPPKPPSRPAPGTMPPKPDTTKLVAALADGLNLDNATVQAAVDKLEAAHKADETARHTAMYAAVAKSLGVSSDAVQAAFEANLPAPPAS